MAIKKQKEKVGALSGEDIRKLLNKKVGYDVAFSLKDENPSDVKRWIPTGCRWLDSIICKGKYAGIPVGKVAELAGLPSSGKSYMAACIAANAQKMGMKVVYFDSESSIDSEFLQKIGLDLNPENFVYIQATTVEFVLETIETLLSQENILYVFDSVANCPCKLDIESDEFNPQSAMARKPRVLSIGMQKLTLPIANANSTLLVLNQLRTNLGDTSQMKINPYFTPGGKALTYSYSLSIWLTGVKAKDSYVLNDKGYRVGSEVKARLQKSRFGTEGRVCNFKIIWGDDPVGIRDMESIFNAISPFLEQAGAWYKIKLKDGTLKSFQRKDWEELMEADSLFKERALEIMDTEVITKFNDRTGDAKFHYGNDEEESVINVE